MSKKVKEQLDQLNQLYKDGTDLYYKAAAAFGLTDTELMILYGLSHMERACTQKELCDRWYLKKQTLHSALQNLIKKDIAVKHPSKKNARVKLISLTDRGKYICSKTAIPFMKGELNAFSKLTATEREMLIMLTAKHKAFIKEEAMKLMNNFKVQENMEIK